MKKNLEKCAQFKKMLYLYNVKEKQILTIKNETIMITKGTAEYKKAQEIANEFDRLSNASHNNGMYFEMCYEKLATALESVMKLQGFASQVATSVNNNMNPNRSKMVTISSKQAWIIACAMVENNIEL